MNATTTVILEDSIPILKNANGNIITTCVKHQRRVVVKQFFGAKIAYMNHYKKPNQEESQAEIIIQISTNDLSSDKERKDIANDIQLAKSVKADANKKAVSSLLPRKKISNKAREVKTHLQDICSTSNLASITHSNINPQCHINVKGLHLNIYSDEQLA